MAASNGTPIRLVKQSGDLIELDATSLAITVNRKTGPLPTPFTGGRSFGVDMNMNGGVIIIEGLFTDDKTSSLSTISSEAVIDFAVTHESVIENTSNLNFFGTQRANLKKLWNSTTGTNPILSTTTLTLTNASGTPRVIRFKKLSSGTFDYSTDGSFTIGINTDASINNYNLAIALRNLIQNETTLNNEFSVTVSASEYIPLLGATRVKITQKTAGTAGNNQSPLWTINTPGFKAPYTTDFRGGEDTKRKSAGDKAMDLYGIMQNSNNKHGIVGGLVGTGLVLGGLAAGVLGGPPGIAAGTGMATAGVDLVGGAIGGGLGHRNDYIIGLQVPYDSMVQADGDTYVARNFFRPVGITKKPSDKGSEANTLAASTKFNFSNGNRVGIKGTVNKFDITYQAGETVYGFVIQFVPIDWIM